MVTYLLNVSSATAPKKHPFLLLSFTLRLSFIFLSFFLNRSDISRSTDSKDVAIEWIEGIQEEVKSFDLLSGPVLVPSTLPPSLTPLLMLFFLDTLIVALKRTNTIGPWPWWAKRSEFYMKAGQKSTSTFAKWKLWESQEISSTSLPPLHLFLTTSCIYFYLFFILVMLLGCCTSTLIRWVLHGMTCIPWRRSGSPSSKSPLSACRYV